MPGAISWVVRPLPESEDIIVNKHDKARSSPESNKRYNAKLLKIRQNISEGEIDCEFFAIFAEQSGGMIENK